MKKRNFIIFALFLVVSCLLASCGHVHNFVKVDEVKATCTEDGKKAYYTCDSCELIFDEEKNVITDQSTLVIKALGHSPARTEAHEATCTEAGNTEYFTCSRCNNYFSDSECKNKIEKDSWIIPAKDHELVHHEALDPTCTEDGNIEYWLCSDCNKYFADQEAKRAINQEDTVIAKHHTLEHVAALAETCTENGNIEYWHCTACDKYFADQEAKRAINQEDTVIAKHHTLEHVAALAETCTEDGNIEYWHCTVCDKYFADSDALVELKADALIIEAHPHPSLYMFAVEAKCETPGNIEYWYCIECQKNFSDNLCTVEIEGDGYVIPATGHNLVHHAAVESTDCTVIGNSEYFSCSNCGKFFADQDAKNEIAENSWIITTPHQWGEVTYTWNDDHSCTAKRVCQVDDKHVEEETVDSSLDELESTDCYYYGLVATFENKDFKAQVYDYLRFTLNDDKASWTVYAGNYPQETMTIPEKINELPVTALGAYAFHDIRNIRTLVIPKTVTTLGDQSVSYMDITSLVFEEGSQLKYIGKLALIADYDLASIVLPNTLTYIGDSAFAASDFEITFNGTIDQWKAISKGYKWNEYSDGCYSIHCTDGDIDDGYVNEDEEFEDDDDWFDDEDW